MADDGLEIGQKVRILSGPFAETFVVSRLWTD
jgi:transcription antitermination factor NusG